jgi:hypothetical protein
MRKTLIAGLVLTVATVIYTIQIARAQPAPQAPAVQWEYRSLVLTNDTNISQFNELGADRWELVAVNSEATTGGQARFTFQGRAYFKRPKLD